MTPGDCPKRTDLMRASIINIIFRKELTEALRDKVTLLVVVGLPLLIYPLAVVFMTGVTKHLEEVKDRHVNTVAVWGSGAQPMFDWLAASNSFLTVERWRGIPGDLRNEIEAGRVIPLEQTNPPSPRVKGMARLAGLESAAQSIPEDALHQAVREVMKAKKADAVLFLYPGFDEAVKRGELGRISVYYDSVIPDSAQAWSRLSEHLENFRLHLLKQRQRERQLPNGFMKALDVREGDVAPVQRQVNNIIGTMLPVLLIVLALVGALVVAADMTAGEKDRATMQTLLCAPVRSVEIVAGKFLAVWTISLISAVANLVGMGLTISRISSAAHVELGSFGLLAMMFGLLLPATWTISAFFLAVAALARDVKDAGNFLGAASYAVILPLGATLLPGVELDAWTCCVPLVNLALLIRTLINGSAAGHLVLLTLVTSLAYAALALVFAARVFGREQIMLGGAFSWRGLLRSERPGAAGPTPGLVLGMFPVVVVGLFYVSLALASQGLQTTLLVAEYGILLLPVVALALVRKFPVAQTFSLRWPHWRSLLGALMIGLSASVAIGGIVFRVAPPPDSLLKQMQEQLQLGDTPGPLWQLWLVLALTPAVCEETFFRGFVLSGLRRWRPWMSIAVSALLFGLLHGSLYRLLPTFLLGVVLGYAVWRSGSLYCSILIHVLNNGLIATLLWFNGGKEMEVHALPWNLTLGALVVMALGLALLRSPKAKAATPTTS